MTFTNACRSVLDHRSEVKPLPSGVESKLVLLPGIKAVVFDVYGTLIVSGSGDVGSADTSDRGEHILSALMAVKLQDRLSSIPSSELLHSIIAESNRERVSGNCPKPEVDIVEVWRRVLQQSGLSMTERMVGDVVGLASNYEARANPTWPMPGAKTLLSRLKAGGIPMGIVSNAQIFTISLVEDLVTGEDLEQGGFALDLCVFSNRFRQAKPGPRLFEVLCRGLKRQGISPQEAVYVGNDMLNDVWAASQAGLRTAWFAGDARSCRPRESEPRCQGLVPDVILTNLLELLECMQIK